METYCTRPDCSQPINNFPELDDPARLKTAQQKYCKYCGMPQILAGRYIPQKFLGKGGFGAAYLACDRYTPKLRKCVVKQFQPSDSFNEKNLQVAEGLFTREAEVLETLGNHHPQIPDLYAFFPLILPDRDGEEEQFFYIVQEFIDGETLEQEAKTRGRFNEDEIVEVLENMLEVLQFVHQHNSIHRDIKPSNIMRSIEGKLYLLDFGAVKRVTGLTSTNSSTGIYSMGFAPPEQMQGRQIYPSTDLYALAATCISLNTGKSIQELYDSYNNKWSWRNYSSISEKLAAILDRMLLPTPKDRYASAQAVLREICALTDLSQGKETPAIEPVQEEPSFSQPADWRSLLSLSKTETEKTPPKNDSPQTGNWQSLLSLSETSEENSGSGFLEETTALQSEKASDSVPSHPEEEDNDYSSLAAEINDPLLLDEESSISLPVTPSDQSSRFPLWKLLTNAGFTGLEGALLLIAFTSLISMPGLSIGLWGMSMGGLIYAQWKQVIKKFQLLIIGGITLLLVILIPPLHSIHGITIPMVIVAAIMAGLGAIALTAIVRTFYQNVTRRPPL